MVAGSILMDEELGAKINAVQFTCRFMHYRITWLEKTASAMDPLVYS